MGTVQIEGRRRVESRPSSLTRQFAHQPALDGLRTVSVFLVLLFHAGFSWMPGGYVGVSVFFTLSGFLITSLLLTESERTHRVDVGAFFARRLRRLMPASLVCLAGVAAVRLAGGFADVPRFRDDLLAGITHTFNWFRIAGDSSYNDAFDGAGTLTSPLEHYWSLAIEEQFYLVWPFALLALTAAARRSGRSIASMLIVGYLIATVSSPFIAAWLGGDVAYWSSVTRMGELLAGAALAAVLLGRTLPPIVGRFALPFLVLIVAAAVLFGSSSGPAYSGWMGVFALASVGLIAALQGDSGVRDVLSSGVLVRLGQVSYGIYLFHWPVFVWMRQRGWDLASFSGFAVAVSVVLVCAGLSYALVERRFRVGVRAPRTSIIGALAVMVVAALVAWSLPFSRGFLEPDRAALSQASASGAAVDVELTLESPERDATERGRIGSDEPVDPIAQIGGPVAIGNDSEVRRQEATDVTLAAPGSRPIRVVVVGDSTAFYVGQAFAQWTVEHPQHTSVDLVTCDGCGFMLDGTVTSWPSANYLASSINMVDNRLPATVANVRPDVVILMSTMSDMANRQWSESEGVLTPFDDEFRARMESSYEGLAASLIDLGVPQVIWIKPPVPKWPGDAVELREVGRWEVMSDVIDDVVDVSGGQVVAIDADAWMNEAGRADDVSFRPDGTHLTEASAYELVERWLAPSVVNLALSAAR